MRYLMSDEQRKMHYLMSDEQRTALELVMASEAPKLIRIREINAATDRAVERGMARPSKDTSGLGALRVEATMNAVRGGHISGGKAAEMLMAWGLM